MNTLGTTSRLVASVVLAVTAIAGVSVPGLANSSGTIYSPGLHAGATYTWKSSTEHLTGTVRDVDAKDARCSRVYDRGYNYVLGWGKWKLLGAVCAGKSKAFGEYITVYSDKVDLRICHGTTTSSSACTVRRIVG